MNVALTGATGFLGLRLVGELLDQHESLTVLSRAGSGDALSRIIRFMELTGAPSQLIAELPGRLHVVETDLAQPRLGLSENAFHELADELDVIWHSAGDINLDGDLAHLRKVNVGGTRSVLALAAAGRRRPLLCHVSTAFVAGRREGIAYEEELHDAGGFENTYERSKYEAERCVRDWSRTHGRPVVVLRPSILVTDVPPHPNMPQHPLHFAGRKARAMLRRAGSGSAGHRPLAVRMVGDPGGHLNVMPVEQAAATMAAVARRQRSELVNTYHIVHPHDVPLTTLTALLEHMAPMKLQLVAEVPTDASALEKAMQTHSGFAPYLSQRRRFDDTAVRTLLGPPGSAIPPVDLDYLLSGVCGWRPAAPAPRAGHVTTEQHHSMTM